MASASLPSPSRAWAGAFRSSLCRPRTISTMPLRTCQQMDAAVPPPHPCKTGSMPTMTPLWGFCCNGERLRLVRDNASLTRPAYVEANLRQLFEGEDFADFAALWLLIHATRFGTAGSPVADCALERWREAGSKQGEAARDRLRDGVEAALLALGTGFLAHQDNGALRERVINGQLPLPDFFGQLLRLVYRLIFLLAAEDRGLLHPPGASAVSTQALCRRLFRWLVAGFRRAPRGLEPLSRSLGRTAYHLRGACTGRISTRPSGARWNLRSLVLFRISRAFAFRIAL